MTRISLLYAILFFAKSRPFAGIGFLVVGSLEWAMRRLSLRRERIQILRIRNGCCPTCNYDLRASKAQCPECGRPIPHGTGIPLREWGTRIAAQKMLDAAREYYSAPRDYISTNLSGIPGLDLSFYDSTRDALAEQGFTFLGDVEDEDTRKHPSRRIAFRVLIADGGSPLVFLLHIPAFDAKVVRLFTEFHDGAFLIVEGVLPGKGLGREVPVSGVRYIARWNSIELGPLFAAYIAAVEKRGESTMPMGCPDMVAALASLRRWQELTVAHRKKIGFIDFDAMEALTAGKMTCWHLNLLLHITSLQEAGAERPAE